MLRVDTTKWAQEVLDLRNLAVSSPDPRTRERFLALYEIANGTANATTWAKSNGWHFQSVQTWIHTYNDRGPAALAFRHTGGWPPLLSGESRKDR